MSVLCEEGLERFWADAKTYLTGTAVPLMDGTAAVGSSSKFAREDHVHPSDSSKQDKLVAGSNITIAADGKTISADNTTYAISKSGSTVTLTGSDGSASTFTDADTTYTTMTAVEMEAGTDTTGKLVTAKDLHDTYVNVTGDTMTGALVMNNANIDVRSSSLTVGSTPSANTYGRQIFLRDSAGTTIGYLQPWINTNGNTYINLNTYREVNGTDIYNGITLGISPTGDRLVSVSAPAAWRTALDVYSKTESDDRFVNVTGDTMTGTLVVRNANINSKSTNITYGTIPSSSTAGTAQINFLDNDNNVFGWIRPYYMADGRSGIQISGRMPGATVRNNILTLASSDGPSDDPYVNVTSPRAWRVALGITAVTSKLNVEWQNQTIAANSSANLTKTITIPTNYSFLGYARTVVDSVGTTSPANATNVVIIGYGLNGTTLNVIVRNLASSQAKVHIQIDVLFIKTILTV